MKELKTPLLLALFILLLCYSDLSKKVYAHGTMIIPESRIYKCRFDGNPENHMDPACRAAIEVGGKQPIYDWNGVRQGDANGQHSEIIPDGQICSGGNPTYKGLDLARNDWRTTPISPDANGEFEFVFYATAPHATKSWTFYITKDGWDPTVPLKWDNLELFCEHGERPLEDMGGKKVYKMRCELPDRAGKHIIFCIWQRSDSGEAFYSCSDVMFAGGGGGTGGGDGGETDDWKQIGVVTSAESLPAGTTITFRLFDENLADIETIEHVVQENQTAQNLWPFYLGETVNANSQLARIGGINGSGEINPTEELNGNLVYIVSDRNLNFAIDKKPPTDTGDINYDYAYPDNIGNYGPGTVVKGTDGGIYECREFPYSGWCNQAPSYYAPGTGWNWEDAWTLNAAIDEEIPTDTGDINYDYAYPDNIGNYGPGTIVKGTDGKIYECKPFPYSGWCNQAPSYYAPGTGWNWEDAWALK